MEERLGDERVTELQRKELLVLQSRAGRLLRVEPSPATPEALPIPVALEREREIASSGTR